VTRGSNNGNRGGMQFHLPPMWLLRSVTIAALMVDAYVHAGLAASYDAVRATVSQGQLFRIEATAASLGVVLLLVAGTRRAVWAYAFVTALAGVAAVLLYRYVNVGQLGPFPNMYEPGWFGEKTASAVAEGVGAITALMGLRRVWGADLQRDVRG
jgi:hypothetical protein